MAGGASWTQARMALRLWDPLRPEPPFQYLLHEIVTLTPQEGPGG